MNSAEWSTTCVCNVVISVILLALFCSSCSERRDYENLSTREPLSRPIVSTAPSRLGPMAIEEVIVPSDSYRTPTTTASRDLAIATPVVDDKSKTDGEAESFQRLADEFIESSSRGISGECIPYITNDWEFLDGLVWAPTKAHLFFNVPLKDGSGVRLVEMDDSQYWQIISNQADISFGLTRRTLSHELTRRGISETYFEPLFKLAMSIAPETVRGVTHFDVSPDGSRIVYSTCTYATHSGDYAYPRDLFNAVVDDVAKYNYEIALSDVDGSDSQRLTVNRSTDMFPIWSPNGLDIAYVSIGQPADDRAPGLYVISVDGSDERNVAPGRTLALRPLVWSPDGSRIAFVALEGASSVVYTIKLDGSELTRVSETVSAPSWSPDSQRLALARSKGNTVILLDVAADGSDPREVTTITNAKNFGNAYTSPVQASIYPWIPTVSWSPQGNYILYNCDAGVCVVDLEGVSVGESPAHMAWFIGVWSPDGRRIAIKGIDVEPGVGTVNLLLYTMAPDGTDIDVLVRESFS